MLLSLLPPEAQLLFLAANSSMSDARILQLMKGDLNWVDVCRLAEREKAASVLWQRIEKLGAGSYSPGAATHLRKLGRVTAFHMSYLEQLVTASAKALDEAGIDYTLLKGAALACSVYGSFVQRPMVDVDILVEKNAGNRAVDALLSVGWVWRAEKPRDGDYSHYHHLPALVDANGLVSVEVHTSMLPPAAPFGITTEEVLASARPIRFRDSEIRVPDPLYLLLHGCIHFAWSHLFRSAAWRTFRDAKALVRHYDLDWGEFVELARSHKAESCCFWTLHLARELIGAPIPDRVLDALRPGLPAVVVRALARHFTLILLPTGTSCPSVTLRRVMWTSGILPRMSGHSRSRPWEILVMSPEDRLLRGLPQVEARGRAYRSGRNWLQYCARVLVPPSQISSTTTSPSV